VPLYFFNIYNDVVTLDDEGADLVDDNAARAHAVKAARSLAAETVMQGHLAAHHYVEVVDGDRQPVATVRFDEAVDLRP
jgi:hypothetical protein